MLKSSKEKKENKSDEDFNLHRVTLKPIGIQNHCYATPNVIHQRAFHGQSHPYVVANIAFVE